MGRDLEALLRLIDARQRIPFAWAQPDDCVSFADAAVFAQCGWRPLRGMRWTTQHGALRVIKRLGGIEPAIDARMTAIAPSMAHRGDIAGVHDPVLGIALMVIEGELLVGPGDQGLKRLRRRAMVRAWSAEQPQ
jgi:hypothetical protein